MNLTIRLLLTISLLITISSSYAASYPTEGYTNETEEITELTSQQQNLLGTAYAGYDPNAVANQVDLHGGLAPDPVLTNNGAAFAIGDSVELDADGFGGSEWYVLNWSTTWSGFLTIFTTGGSPAETQIGGTDAAFLGPTVPISGEWYILALLASGYGAYQYRKKRKKLTI